MFEKHHEDEYVRQEAKTVEGYLGKVHDLLCRVQWFGGGQCRVQGTLLLTIARSRVEQNLWLC